MLKDKLCPNVNTEEWKSAVNKYGVDGALRLWISGNVDNNQEFIETKKRLLKILPKNVGVELVDQIASNPDAIGTYLNHAIQLTKSGLNKVEYHEAFHSIYRLALSQEEREVYNDIAYQEVLKLAKTTNSSVADMIRAKKVEGYYNGLSLQQALPEFLEEYMADKFQTYMGRKKPATLLGQLFKRLSDIIKSFISKKQDLSLVFKKIERGDYRNAYAIQDEFYNSPAYKLLSKATRGEGEDAISPSFKANETGEIIRDVASYYFEFKESKLFASKNDSQIVDKILDLKKNQYKEYANVNPDANVNEHDLYFLFSDEDVQVDDQIILGERTKLKKEVMRYLKNFKRISDLAKDSDEDRFSDEDGGERAYLNAEMKPEAGWGTLPEFVRGFIGAVSYIVDDTKPIGTREDIENGVLVTKNVYERKGVNPTKVYNGLLRALANEFSEKAMVEKLISYGDKVEYEDANGNLTTDGSNIDTYHFVNYFIKKTGINIRKLRDNDPDGFLPKDDAEAHLVYRKIIQGFNRWAKDTLFTQIDIETKESKVFLANRKNVAQRQLEQWHNNFKNSKIDYADINNDLKTILPLFNASFPYYTEQTVRMGYAKDRKRSSVLGRDIGKVKATMAKLGINLSPNFIKYSLLYPKLEKLEKAGDSLGEDTLTEEEHRFLKTTTINKNERLTADIITQLALNSARKDSPYEYKDGETFENNSAAISTLTDLAKGNALLDESVFESSYLAADGTMRYLHQDGTYHLKAIAKLRDPEFIAQLRDSGIRDPKIIVGTNKDKIQVNIDDVDKEFVTKNFLLQEGNDFLKVFKTLKIRELDGIKAVQTQYIVDDEGAIDPDDNGQPVIKTIEQFDGVHFGDMSERDFAITLYNLYASPEFVLSDNNEKIYTVPQLISVMETSKSSDYAYLPIIYDLANGSRPSDKMIGIIRDELNKEIDRINTTYNQIIDKETKEFKSDAKIQEELGFIADEYHNGKRRALTISDKLSPLFSSDFIKKLEEAAKNSNSETVKVDGFRIESEIEKGLQQMLDDTFKVLEQQQIIEPVFENITLEFEGKEMTDNMFVGYKSKFLSNKYSKEDENLSFKKDLSHNIAQVTFQQFINTMALSHLIHGDNALMYKNDGKDPYKREKPNNAKIVKFKHKDTIESLGVTEFEYSNILIIEEPKDQSKLFPQEKVKDRVDQADAQMWCSVQAKRNYLHGLGRLTSQIANLLDRMEAGEELKASDFFEADGTVIDQNRFINSDKLVFKDSKRTVKMSVVPLTKQLTSVRINGVWTARPGMEQLHNMREAMDSQGINFVAPKSAFKTYRSNILQANNESKTEYDFSQARPQLYDNEFFGLQMENPSNKVKITSPTQLQHAIDNEQNDDETSYIIGNNEELSIKEIRKAYGKALADKADALFLSAKGEMYQLGQLGKDVNELIQGGFITPRLAHFQKKALEGLQASGADPQLLEFFEVSDEDVPLYNLNNDLVLEKYTQLYLAHFSKGAFSFKNPGHSVALFSNYGITSMKQVVAIHNGQVEWRTIRSDSEEYKAHVKNGNIKTPNWKTRLEGEDVKYIDDNLEIGDLFVDKPAYNVPEWKDGKIVGYYSEMILPHQTKDQVDLDNKQTINDVISRMFGNRIPLQDKHSMLSLKWIDVLPLQYGSTGVFPSEIIELSGADFDIDKLYITGFDTYIKDNKFVRYGEKTTKTEQFDEYLKWTLKNNKFLKSLLKDKKETDAGYNELLESVKVIGQQIKELKKSKLYKETKASNDLQKLIESLDLTTTSEEGYEEYSYDPAFDRSELDKATKNRLLDVKRFNALTATELELNDQIVNIQALMAQKEYDLLLEVMHDNTPELPHTLEQFKNSDNVGNANNMYLKTMLSMLTNDSVRNGVADQPATQTYLASGGNRNGTSMNPAFIRKDGSEVFGEGKKYPIDSFLGHLNTKRKNNIGKDNIGIDVSGNVQNSVFKKGKVKLIGTKTVSAFKLYNTFDPNDLSKNLKPHRFSDLGVYKEFDFETGDYTGERVMQSTSTKISASTDENKDGNNARFNLGKEESKLISVGNGLMGIPLEVMIALVNQPVLKPFMASNSKAAVKTESEQKYTDVEKSLADKIKEYDKALEAKEALVKTMTEKYGNLERFFSFDSLAKMLKGEDIVESKQENDIIVEVIENMTLDQYQSLLGLASKRSLVGDILKLNKGIDSFSTISKAKEAAFQLGITTGKLAEDMPFDLRYLFTGDNEYLGDSDYVHEVSKVYLKNIDEIDSLSQLNFITKTPYAKEIMRRMTTNWFFTKEDELKQLSKDFMSFMTLASYKMVMNEFGEQTNTFTNRLIMGSSDQTIVALYKKMKEKAPNNALVNYVISNVKQIGEGSGKEQFNTLEANSFTRLNDIQLGNLINSFIELYQNEDTQEFAKALFDYVIIKDGLQFKNKSITKIFPAEIFSNITVSTGLAHDVLLASDLQGLITAVDNVNALLAEDNPLFTEEERQAIGKSTDLASAIDSVYEKVFGLSRKGLYNRFAHLIAVQPFYAKKTKTLRLNQSTVISQTPYTLTLDFNKLGKDEAAAAFTQIGIGTNQEKTIAFFPQFVQNSGKIFKLITLDQTHDPNGLQLEYSPGQVNTQKDTIFTGRTATYQWIAKNNNPEWNQMADLLDLRLSVPSQPVTKTEVAQVEVKKELPVAPPNNLFEDDLFGDTFDDSALGFETQDDIYGYVGTSPFKNNNTKDNSTRCQ